MTKAHVGLAALAWALACFSACGGTFATVDKETGAVDADDASLPAVDGATTKDGSSGPSDAGSSSDAGDGGGKADSGIPSACDAEGSCVLLHASCCGRTCSEPTKKDFIAVARDEATGFSQSRCQGDMPCPGCVAPQRPFVDGNFQAVCRAGTCTVIDVREEAFSLCSRDTDCKIRGSDCCECGSTHFVTLLSSQVSNYTKAICPSQPACGRCAPVVPAVTTRCDPTTRHCRFQE